MRCRFASAEITRFAMTVALAGLGAVLPLVVPTPTSAEDNATTGAANTAAAPRAQANHEWEVSIAPYLWLSDVVADVSFRNFSATRPRTTRDGFAPTSMPAAATGT